MPVEIDIDHVARLARLALTDDERERLRAQLAVILEHAARVSEVATSDVPPTASAIPSANVLRADEPRASLASERAIANAPASEDGRFRVPRITEVE